MFIEDSTRQRRGRVAAAVAAVLMAAAGGRGALAQAPQVASTAAPSPALSSDGGSSGANETSGGGSNGTSSGGSNEAAAGGGDEFEAVIVTGSRISGRTVLQSEAPIEVFSGAELLSSNKTDLLQSLSVQVPSLDVPMNATNGLAARVIRGAYIRGLSPGETLVLVDGKRRHATASVGAGGSDAAQPADLGLIPASAIDHVEVLLDGASALYGSDAIAGVINIITKKDDSGGEFSARSGAYYTGQGFNWSARGGQGFKLGSDGHVYVSVEADRQERTYQGGPAPDGMLYYFPTINGVEVNPATRPGGAPATGSAISGALSAPFLPAGATPSPLEASRNNSAQQIAGQTPYEMFAGTVDASLPLAGGAELYSFSTYTYRDAQSFNGFRLPDRNEVVRALFPDGFSPVNTQLENDFEETLGVRGTWGEWSYDFSSDYGGNYANIGASNTDNPSFGLQSQTSFHIGNLGFQSWVTNFDLRRSLDLPFMAKPSEVSGGLEYRRDYFQISPGDYQSYSNGGQAVLDGPNAGTSLSGPGGDGAQATFGYRPQEATSASRRNSAAYLGLALYPTEKWLINLAGRNEDYDDVGNAWVGRFSTRYELTPKLALRGTVSNGFQAPSLGTEAMQKLQNWNTYVGYTLAVDSAGARAFGAQPLKPERSRNYSVGFVAQLPHSINLTLDAYQVDVDNRIALSNQIRASTYTGANSAAVLALLQAAGLDDTPALVASKNDPSLNFFINAANTRTRGLEGTLEGSEGLGPWGRLRWNLSANYNDTTVRSFFQTPQSLAQYGVSLYTAGNLTNLRYLTPRDKEVASLTWTKGPWSATVRESHYGSMPRSMTVTNWNYPAVFGGTLFYNDGFLFITDLNGAYEVNDHFSITLGINNAFDRRPIKLTGPYTSPTAIWSYDATGAISSDGGSYVLGFRLNW